MTFGELREAVHRGDWGTLANAELTPDQEGYVNRLVGPQMKRYRDARLLLEAEDPLEYEMRTRSVEEAGGSLDGVLRWYACDVAEEALRLYGNGDPRSLKGIEVSRKYVLGEVSREELKAARQAARAAVSAVSDAADAAAYAADAAAEAAAAAYAATDAAYDAVYYTADAAATAAHAAAYYVEALANLEGWFRCYLMRWVEEGAWWE